MSAVPVDAYRVLVVDDEKSIHKVICDSLSVYGPALHIDCVTDAEAASGLLDQSLYDLAILDIYGKDGQQIGTEVYRRIDARNLATRVLLMTMYDLKEDARRLLQLTGSPSSWRLAGFLDKQVHFAAAVKAQVGRRLEQFRKSEASIEGLDDVAFQIKKKRFRYRSQQGDIVLRSSRDEIAAELDRLIRKLYVELPGGAQRKSRISITLEPMDRRGLSAAVVVGATIDVTFADLARRVGGHKTVLKIGPKEEILEEAARYSEYVRYGVKLIERVELLAVAGADALGGLIYSFAGGLYNHDMMPLDEVLVDDMGSGDLSLSTAALVSLFDNQNWYSVKADNEDVGDYFDRNYRTDLRRSINEGTKQLLQLAKDQADTAPWVEKIEKATSSYLEVTTSSGTKVIIPDASVLGWGKLLYSAPTCLVHGDMHGGNVLLECSVGSASEIRKHYRSCLIDYRNAGPGPRCIDAVCLESTIRLADAELASARSRGDSSGVTSAKIANEMVDRLEAEKDLYKAVFLGQGSVPDVEWAKLSATVLIGLRGCFPDVSLQEYLAVSIRYTIRSFGFPISNFARYRFAAWLGAQYELARNLDD
jgi:CheY-like chemotaxis protein